MIHLVYYFCRKKIREDTSNSVMITGGTTYMPFPMNLLTVTM